MGLFDLKCAIIPGSWESQRTLEIWDFGLKNYLFNKSLTQNAFERFSTATMLLWR